MATSYGKLQEFKPDTEPFKAYFERVDLYFTANEIEAGKQVPILLNCIGASTYELLRVFFAPNTPSQKSLSDIIEALSKHYEPQRSIIVERFHFHKRNQAMGETIAEYDAATCKFGDALQDTLRDRLVCGLTHESVQRRLLSEKELTYAKAIEIARGMEAADKVVSPLKQLKLQSINYSEFRKQKKGACGHSNHLAADCKMHAVTCVEKHLRPPVDPNQNQSRIDIQVNIRLM